MTGTQDAATGAPTFRGSAKAGLALTAVTNTIIDADGKPDTFTYQWMRVDADGTSNAVDIGADSNTYLLVEDDIGKRIKVRVDYTDDLGGSESRTSDAYPPAGTVQAIDTVLVARSWEGAPRDASDAPVFGAGQRYRLLVVTSKHVITGPVDSDNSRDVAVHNSSVADDTTGVGANSILAPYKDGFRALVSTTGDSSADPPIPAAVARDNTETTGTGVPIYWFKGDKVADDYADFYDDSWTATPPQTMMECSWWIQADAYGPGHAQMEHGATEPWDPGTSLHSDAASSLEKKSRTPYQINRPAKPAPTRSPPYLRLRTPPPLQQPTAPSGTPPASGHTWNP